MKKISQPAQSRLRYTRRAKAQLEQYRNTDTPIYLCFKTVLEAIDAKGPMMPGAVMMKFEHRGQMVRYVRFTAPGSGQDRYLVVWEESRAHGKDMDNSLAVIHFIGRH